LTSEELLKSGGLFKTRITLMDAFIADPKAPTPEEQSAAEMMKQGSGDSHFIELRELSSAELLEIQGLEGKAVTEHMEKILGGCITDHSFEKADGKKTPSEDVVKIIRLSGSLMTHVLTKWQEALPLARRMRRALGERPASSSPGAR